MSISILQKFGGKTLHEKLVYVGDDVRRKAYPVRYISIRAEDYHRAYMTGALKLSKTQAKSTVQNGAVVYQSFGNAINKQKIKKLTDAYFSAITKGVFVVSSAGEIVAGNHRTCSIDLRYRFGMWGSEEKNTEITVCEVINDMTKEDFVIWQSNDNNNAKDAWHSQVINSGNNVSRDYLTQINKLFQKRFDRPYLNKEMQELVLRVAQVLNNDDVINAVHKGSGMTLSPADVYNLKNKGFLDKDEALYQELCPPLKNKQTLKKTLDWLDNQLDGFMFLMNFLKFDKSFKSLVPKNQGICQALLA